jgi:hypothetical protein
MHQTFCDIIYELFWNESHTFQLHDKDHSRGSLSRRSVPETRTEAPVRPHSGVLVIPDQNFLLPHRPITFETVQTLQS